jgi:hypothetical protein
VDQTRLALATLGSSGHVAPGACQPGELGKLRKQVLAIGRNINQAVHAMNAANQPGSTLEVARIAAPFLETCGDLKALLMETRRAISSYVGGEVGYWVDAFRDRPR